MVLASGRQPELWKDIVAPERCILSLVAGARGFVAARCAFSPSLGIHFFSSSFWITLDWGRMFVVVFECLSSLNFSYDLPPPRAA